jgi:hypothetical protein
MRYLGIVAILAFLASPALGVYVVHDLEGYTVGQALTQAGGAFTQDGYDSTGRIDVVDFGGNKVARVDGSNQADNSYAYAKTDNTGAGNVNRLAGMLYSGFSIYAPSGGSYPGNNIYDFQLLRGTDALVTKLIGNPGGGYMRNPYMTAGGSFSITADTWHTVRIENYSDGTDANSWVRLYVDNVLIDHITKATAGYGIWPAECSNAGAKAQRLMITATPRSDGGDIVYLDNIWGGNTIIPEPATLGLLLLGLPFLRRRR